MGDIENPARRRWLVEGAMALGAGVGVAAGVGGLPGCAAPAPPRRAMARIGSSRIDAADVALVNRVTFGVDSAALAQFNRGSRQDFLQMQLHPPPDAVAPPDVQAQIDALPLFNKPLEQWVAQLEQQRRAMQDITDDAAKTEAQQAYQRDLNRLARDAASRSLLLALYSPCQLREQLTWFWFNHFNVHQYKANLRILVGDYEDRLRKHALGKFADLLVASATHPAMIHYLDNEQNAVNRINENYAREVMELHTLGVDAGYAQGDVQELARVLTGLGIRANDRTPNLRPALASLYVRDGLMEFNPNRHDMGVKTVLGERVAPGGLGEIIGQLTRLARHPATARHVSRKLAVYFVDDQPPPAIVDRMSRVFLATDGDIALVLQAMFESNEFDASLGRKFKDPVHYVVSAVKLAYDAEGPGGRTILNAQPMLGWLNRLGEGLYNHQTPDGYPMDEASWSSSGQMSTRFEIARGIGGGSSGLFRAEGAPADRPAFPQLSNAVYHAALAPTYAAPTLAALDGATSPQEWNALLLSSPEFMRR